MRQTVRNNWQVRDARKKLEKSRARAMRLAEVPAELRQQFKEAYKEKV